MKKSEKTEFIIRAPAGFDYVRTLRSHGWYDLPPFELIGDDVLARVLDVGEGVPVTAFISADPAGLRVGTAGRLGRRALARVERDVRHMFRLDEQLEAFYALLSSDAEFVWVARDGAGRLLRSPTVYEDLVKSIMTTNCSWSLTNKMVTELVRNIGREAADGRRAFPTAEEMAEQPPGFYREVVRAGYRADYLKELAERVAAGEIDPESWLGSDLPTPELKREMKRVKGVGDYAAENLLKLVGRYDVLALDSWVRGKFRKVRNRGNECDDGKITRFYSRFGEWRGLALWCDMTRDWFEER